MIDGLTMRILLAASEMVGFAKTGGLADVIGSLPGALANLGHKPAVILPLHRTIRTGGHPLAPTNHKLRIPLGKQILEGALWQTVVPGSNIPVYLVEQPSFFERDDESRGTGLYQFTEHGQSRDYGDNFERFLFFSRAILEAIPLLDLWPDLLHLNDWQTGLVPLLLRELYCKGNIAGRQEQFRCIRTLFTIHNIAYQGNFSRWNLRLTGLDWNLFNPDQLEYHGKVSFLKAGLVFADALSTVSPTYAREIQTSEYGCGLEGVLSHRRDSLYGIVNGIDTDIWNPATDPQLPAHYSAQAIHPGKNICKKALQKRFGLPGNPETPVLGVVARLTEQKGIDLILQAAGSLLQQDVQLMILGKGNPIYHQKLEELRGKHSSKVGLFLGFDEPLAHLIEAGSDLFLMPSVYEPSGLNQLYSLRYGTPPVVRATGGLADTIVDATPEQVASGKATGFCFGPPTVEAFLEAIHRGLSLYNSRSQSNAWDQLLKTAMQEDWSWERSAKQYQNLYEHLLSLSARSRD